MVISKKRNEDMTDNKRKSFSDIISNKKNKGINEEYNTEKYDKSKLITFQLSESRWMALKLRSLEEKRSMKDIIIEAIAKDYQLKGLNW